MVSRKVSVRKAAAENIASIAWFIESKGLVATAENFSDNVYDFLESLGNTVKSHAFCREPKRALLGYKCVPYKKKYTVVFIETDREIIISEFISSKLIYW